MTYALTEEVGDPDIRNRGPGDRIFAMVFRSIYGEEIEKVTGEAIQDGFKRQLDAAQRQPPCRLPDPERSNRRELCSPRDSSIMTQKGRRNGT